jgi:hypothetical protein
MMMRSYLAAAALLLLSAVPVPAQVGSSSLNGGTANPQIPDLSMCLPHPATFNHVWFVDPINGHTVSGGGAGSAAAPWNSLQAVFSTVTGYPGPLLTTAPGGVGPVAPGDEVVLMNGAATDYGAISVANTQNTSFVTIAQAPGQSATLAQLSVTNSSEFGFEGFSVQSVNPTGSRSSFGVLVAATLTGASVAHDVYFDHLTISSASNSTTATWTTQAIWQDNIQQGVLLGRDARTPDGGDGRCFGITNSTLFNVANAISVFTDNAYALNNEIFFYGDDAVDFGGDNLVLHGNSIHDNINIGDGTHIDAMQAFVGRAWYHDILVDGNTIIWNTQQVPFATLTPTEIDGGITSNDIGIVREVITNNIVVFPNNNITTVACRDCLVAGNTVLPAVDQSSGTGLAGDIRVNLISNELEIGDNTVVRNNLVSSLAINDPTAFVEHNIMITSGTSLGAKSNFGGTFFNTPGTYCNGSLGCGSSLPTGTGGGGGDNVYTTPPSGCAGTGTAADITACVQGEIALFNFGGPTSFSYDFHLISGAPAVGFGTNTTPTPTVDINGIPRSPTHDAGAHVFQ